MVITSRTGSEVVAPALGENELAQHPAAGVADHQHQALLRLLPQERRHQGGEIGRGGDA